MTDPMREIHFTVPPGLRPRHEFDPGISDATTIDNAVNLDLLGATAPPYPNGRLVSSAFGGLGRMLFTINDYALEDGYRNVFEGVFQSLPDTTRLVVLCYGDKRGEVETLLDDGGVLKRAEIVETGALINFSVWAEDAYVVIQQDGHGAPTLLEPANFTRYDDGFIADIVAAQTDIGSHSVPLYYQGGNVLIGDDYWMIGADYPSKAHKLGLVQAKPGETRREAALRRYGEEIDATRRLVILGTKNPVPEERLRDITVNGQPWKERVYYATGVHQPLFHIDMFVTLAGRNADGEPIAVVGDPGMAAQILGEPEMPEMLIPYYHDIAARLAAEGFQVVRSPLPLTYADDSALSERTWYFATANNALVEIKGDSKRVWLPTYGHGPQAHLVATDKENERIWREELGFKVHMLPDFHPFAYNAGAVHCISKYLERD